MLPRDKLMLPDDATIHLLFNIPKTEMLWNIETGVDMFGDQYISVSTLRGKNVKSYDYKHDNRFSQLYLTLARYINAQSRLGNWRVEPNQVSSGFLAHRLSIPGGNQE